MVRKSWDEYFADIAIEVSMRSTCPRLSVGAVLVRDKRIISTGYNGVPVGVPHCVDVGCVLVDGHCSLVVHAEANAIRYCPVDTRYSTMYVTHTPCVDCMKGMYDAGVRRIVYDGTYNPKDYAAILKLSSNEMPEVVKLIRDTAI